MPRDLRPYTFDDAQCQGAGCGVSASGAAKSWNAVGSLLATSAGWACDMTTVSDAAYPSASPLEATQVARTPVQSDPCRTWK